MTKKSKKTKMIIVKPIKKGDRDKLQLKIKEPKTEDIKPKDIFEGYK